MPKSATFTVKVSSSLKTEGIVRKQHVPVGSCSSTSLHSRCAQKKPGKLYFPPVPPGKSSVFLFCNGGKCNSEKKVRKWERDQLYLISICMGKWTDHKKQKSASNIHQYLSLNLAILFTWWNHHSEYFLFFLFINLNWKWSWWRKILDATVIRYIFWIELPLWTFQD